MSGWWGTHFWFVFDNITSQSCILVTCPNKHDTTITGLVLSNGILKEFEEKDIDSELLLDNDEDP